jgi:hypothetical protein
MSGISNLSILVQHGGNSQEVHQAKQQSVEHTQTVAAQEEATRAVEAKARISESEGSEKPYLNREKSREGKGEQSSERQKREKKKEKKESASTGNFLDTVA